MKQNEIKILLLIIIILVIGGVLFLKFRTKNNVADFSNDEDKFISDYEELNYKESVNGNDYPTVTLDDNRIKYIDIDETLEILDNGYGVIYFGYPTCIYCRNAIQVLIDTVKETELEYIYYLDISKIWNVKELDENGNVIEVQEANDKYSDLLNALGEEFLSDYVIEDKEGKEINLSEKRVEIPLVVFVVNGDIVSYRKGTLFSQMDPYIPLDKDQVAGLSEIYKYGINDVLNALEEHGASLSVK